MSDDLAPSLLRAIRADIGAMTLQPEMTKVFLVLFVHKKNCLLSFPC
jgi:hypothetical protein